MMQAHSKPKKYILRSKPVKKLVIFALIGFILAVAATIGFVFIEDNLAIQITMWVFLGIFIIVSSVILWVQLFHFVTVDDKYLIKHKLFFKKKIPFDKIDKVVNNNGLFDVFVDEKRVLTLSTDDLTTERIVVFLEKHNVKVKW